MQKPRFYKHYQHVVVEDLLLTFNINSIMQLPQAQKVVLNTSCKVYVLDKKAVSRAFAALQLLTGQIGKVTLARHSIAAFKLRQHNLLGCKVSLRGTKMYIFLEKLMTFVLPGVREFGVHKSNEFDNFGNINLGVSNLLLFTELQPFFSFFDSLSGINITVNTSSSQNLPVYKKSSFPHSKAVYHSSLPLIEEGSRIDVVPQMKNKNNTKNSLSNLSALRACNFRSIKEGSTKNNTLRLHNSVFFSAFQYPEFSLKN